MNLWNKYKNFMQEERELIADNLTAIQASNKKLFTVFMCCGIGILLILLAVTFFVEVYAELRSGYLIVIALISVLLCIQHSRMAVSSRLMYYIFYGMFALYAAYSSAFVTPDFAGITILAILFQIPIFIMDYRMRIVLYEMGLVAMYLAIVLPYKAPILVEDEIVNTVAFMIIGCVAGTVFQHVHLQNIDLARRLNIERTIDVLTGLPNRRMLFEYFVEYETGKADAKAYAVAMIDIDNFKLYNDTYGHVAGDRCLEKIGGCFIKFGSENAIKFYRYGGEEFVAVVEQKTDSSLTEIFTKLNKAIEDMEIKHSGQPCGYVTVSIGVTKLENSNKVVDFERKINDADKALYEVKSNGKGRTLEYEYSTIY